MFFLKKSGLSVCHSGEISRSKGEIYANDVGKSKRNKIELISQGSS
jgi:hypothetical protein